MRTVAVALTEGGSALPPSLSFLEGPVTCIGPDDPDVTAASNGSARIEAYVFSIHALQRFVSACDTPDVSFWYVHRDRPHDLGQRQDVSALQAAVVATGNHAEAKLLNDVLIEVEVFRRAVECHHHPRALQVEHTSRCNAECIMCSHHYLRNSKAKDMSEDLFRRIEPLLPFARDVYLHGFGEPLLRRDIMKSLEVYRRYGIRLYSNTNLSVLPDELLPFLRSDFNGLNVSCDGADSATFETIRRNLRFDRFVKNVERLRRECPDLPINLFVVSLRQNIEQSARFVELAHEWGIGSVCFSRGAANDIAGNHEDDIAHYPATCAHHYRKAILRGQQLGIRVGIPRGFSSLEGDPDRLALERTRMARLPMYGIDAQAMEARARAAPGNGEPFWCRLGEREVDTGLGQCQGICDRFYEFLYIGADGRLPTCCHNVGYHVDNLLDHESFQAYWNSPMVQRLRRRFFDGSLPAFCQ